MTVTTTANSISYVGNGTTTAFAFPYVFFVPADLVVTLIITATGVPVVPAPVLNGAATYDYTVSGTVAHGEYASGGTVTFNTAPLSTHTVSIVRAVAPTQLVTLIDNTKFPADTVNTEFDKLTVLAQQALSVTSNVDTTALQIPDNEVGLTVVAVPAASRAGKLLLWDGSGNLSTLDPASIIGGAVPSGPAGGGLSGTYPNPTIAPGTNGQLLATVGGVSTWSTIPQPIVTVFTASGTWTPNAKMIYAVAEGWGAGGAGGSTAAGSSADSSINGGGGAAGSWAKVIITKAAAGASQVVTIGAAAAQPAAGNVNGGVGGDTSLGALLVAKGGAGGIGSAAGGSNSLGGLGVVAGNVGDETGPGMSGGAGYAIGGGNTMGSNIGGSATPIGSGGRAVNGFTSQGNGEAAIGFASGGSGASSFNGGAGQRGGRGTGGYLVIIEYCSP